MSATPLSAYGDRASVWVTGHAPGLVLVGVVACAAWGMLTFEGVGQVSPLILALLLGAALRTLMEIPTAARPGMLFAQKKVLRAAIVLLGLQLSLGKIAAIGAVGVVAAALSVIITFTFTLWLGKLMRLDSGLTALIAGGCSICGASAVTAFNTVARADEEDVCYAMVVITLCGALAMLILPPAAGALGLTDREFGLWAGASIHEVAQVAGASFQRGDIAGETGMVTKFVRVLLLAPTVMAFSWAWRVRGGKGRGAVTAPWFLGGFVAMAALASIVNPSPAVLALCSQITSMLMTLALAAMGLDADLRRLWSRGVKPLLLAGAASLMIVGVSLAMVMAL